MLRGFEFHHLGVACSRIEDERSVWQAFGYSIEGDAFVDEAQGIRGQFLTGGGPRVELLEPLPGSTTLTPWLNRRVKFYHAGYLVASVEHALRDLLALGATETRAPLLSAYFKAPIAFLMMPNMMLVEVIETRAMEPL